MSNREKYTLFADTILTVELLPPYFLLLILFQGK